ncbi:hypothetical protein E3N88_26529 [Mikania micrantha]|uniref:Uncharacterized protein n=1 Tax=Mikania micrantha TaxID=192012 RepID=A0A5N6MU94_9ASTR|nr:hypothetical protein E3N88_26529 [Mikania micrantha]
MAGRGEFRWNLRRGADRGNEDDGRDPLDIAEIARLQQRVRDLELEREEVEEETETDSIIRDNGEGDANPFGRHARHQGVFDHDPLRHMSIKIELSDKFPPPIEVMVADATAPESYATTYVIAHCKWTPL